VPNFRITDIDATRFLEVDGKMVADNDPAILEQLRREDVEQKAFLEKMKNDFEMLQAERNEYVDNELEMALSPAPPPRIEPAPPVAETQSDRTVQNLASLGEQVSKEVPPTIPDDEQIPIPELVSPHAPVVTEQTGGDAACAGASDGSAANSDANLPWWRVKHDIPEMWKNIGASLHSRQKQPSNAAIAKEIEARINDIERSKATGRKSPDWDTIRGVFTGWKWKPPE
jgi:hypothetical protein